MLGERELTASASSCRITSWRRGACSGQEDGSAPSEDHRDHDVVGAMGGEWGGLTPDAMATKHIGRRREGVRDAAQWYRNRWKNGPGGAAVPTTINLTALKAATQESDAKERGSNS